MKTYIALLRGINVTGYNMIKMKDLTVHLASLKYSNIKTYIQSGNILFESDNKESKIFEKEIHHLIENKFGFNVPVIVKTTEEMKKVHKNNPFVNGSNSDINKLYVTFLSEAPLKENIVKMVETKIDADEFILTDDNNVVYLNCGNGYGKTKLSNTFFESKLKVTATTRSWKTVEKLVEMSR